MDDNTKKFTWLRVLLAIASIIGLTLLYVLLNNQGYAKGLENLIGNVIPDNRRIDYYSNYLFLIHTSGTIPRKRFNQFYCE